VRAPALVLALALAVAVWSGFFDLYVSRGAREYLQLRAEFELGRGPQPSMESVMSQARSAGVIAASLWAAAAFGTVCAASVVNRRRPARSTTTSR